MAFLIGGANTLAADAYDVGNSCRFNDDDTAYMHLTPGSAGDQKKWTFSCWFKRGNLGGTAGEMRIFGGNANASHIYINSSDLIRWDMADDGSGSGDAALSPSMKFRDCSAWYHLVCALDTDNGTADNRMRMYVNGTEITSFAVRSNPDSGHATNAMNDDTQHSIGYRTGDQGSAGMEFDGYMAEVCFVNSEQLAATSFGKFDSSSPTIWKPIDVSGLTFGTNGFYLDFESSGNLGNDANGGTDWTEVNLAATDQATDTPTNNFCTMNPLDTLPSPQSVFSEGNLKLAYSGSNGIGAGSTGTIWLTSGKWYLEMKLTAKDDTGTGIGITDRVAITNAATYRVGGGGNDYTMDDSNGKIYNNGDGGTSYGSAYDVGDIMGIYIDLDNNKLYFTEDGTLGSATGHSITAASSVSNGAYSFAVGMVSSSGTATYEVNFGGCPSYTISSAVSDDNGYGSFEFSPNITGDSEAKKFYAICTKNLAEFG